MTFDGGSSIVALPPCIEHRKLAQWHPHICFIYFFLVEHTLKFLSCFFLPLDWVVGGGDLNLLTCILISFLE